MGKFAEMIADMKRASYQEKMQFLGYFLNVAQRNRREIEEDDRQALLDYFSQLGDSLPRVIQDTESYREKDILFACTDGILQLVMAMFPSPDQVDPTIVQKLTSLSEMVTRQRSIETALDSIMEKDALDEQDINRLLYWVRQASDEYQRGRLLAGLIHYAEDLEKLSPDAQTLLGNFLLTEFQRWLAAENPDGEVLGNLELMADVAKHFPSEEMVQCLGALLQSNNNTIRYFALESLLHLEQPVPDAVIHDLAADEVHANNTYNLLVRWGIPHRFPECYASEENLAKSDMIHWLTYPTELNQVPDEIQYMGKVKFLLRREVYHIFKFRSGSVNLSEEAKNQWLIGWSSRKGGTFSNFDKLSEYQRDTLEKTLKNIKNKLIR